MVEQVHPWFNGSIIRSLYLLTMTLCLICSVQKQANSLRHMNARARAAIFKRSKHSKRLDTRPNHVGMWVVVWALAAVVKTYPRVGWSMF